MKTIWSNVLFVALILLFIGAGCKPQPTGLQPPEIKYGFDTCDECGMQIDEPRFAAASLLTNDEYRKFDDIGEMLIYHMDHPEAQVQAWFVHDYHSEEWMRGEEAHFVRSQSIETPMGFGIVAFQERAKAESYAAENDGQVYTLDDLRAALHAEVHG
jgi:copper chaperone NosL